MLLPAAPGLRFPQLLGVFLLAQVAGLVSHVPAGLGVFETVMVLLLAPWLPGDAVLGSVLAYRIVYYLMPVRASALTLFAGFEAARAAARAARRAATGSAQWAAELVPRVFAAIDLRGRRDAAGLGRDARRAGPHRGCSRACCRSR